MKDTFCQESDGILSRSVKTEDVCGFFCSRKILKPQMTTSFVRPEKTDNDSRRDRQETYKRRTQTDNRDKRGRHTMTERHLK